MVHRDDIVAEARDWLGTPYRHQASLKGVGCDNPVSSVYGAPMVDPDGIYLWTWDARPWPAFPVLEDVWSDGPNWQRGHWLNGRLGGCGVDGLIRALLDDFGVTAGDVQIGNIEGALDGFVTSGPTSARQVIEGLAAGFGFHAADTGTMLVFRSAIGAAVATYAANDLAEISADAALMTITRAQEAELPLELRLGFADPLRDFARVSVASRRLAGLSRRVATLDLNVSAEAGGMQLAADARLRDAWTGRNRFSFALPPSEIGLEPGDIIALTDEATTVPVRIEAIEDGLMRRIEARNLDPEPLRERRSASNPRGATPPATAGPPLVHILDLPLLQGDEPPHAARIAAFAKPWLGGMSVWRSATGAGFEPVLDMDLPATIGELTVPLGPGPEGRFDRANTLIVKLAGGTLSSVTEADVLAGANVAAVQCANGMWEVLQFSQAELIGVDTWALTGLLRAQGGSDAAMHAGAEIGAAFVLLDGRVPLLDAGLERIGLEQFYRVGPIGRAIDDPAMTALTHAASGEGLRPLSSVHVRARRDPSSGDITLSWVRRTRIGGDSWAQVEVPLAEDVEAYELDVLGPGDLVLRTLATDAPTVSYSAANQVSDFGSLPSALTVTVQQLSATFGRGTARKVSLHV